MIPRGFSDDTFTDSENVNFKVLVVIITSKLSKRGLTLSPFTKLAINPSSSNTTLEGFSARSNTAPLSMLTNVLFSSVPRSGSLVMKSRSSLSSCMFTMLVLTP